MSSLWLDLNTHHSGKGRNQRPVESPAVSRQEITVTFPGLEAVGTEEQVGVLDC